MLQFAVKQAGHRADIARPVFCHTFRRTFATHWLASGHDVRAAHQSAWHIGVSTTLIYLHVLNRGGRGVTSGGDSP